MVVRLDCPLCGATVVDGAVPAPGRCAGCGARYVGGTERPVGAATAMLAALDLDASLADAAVAAMFADDQDPAAAAVTSDRRDGFYAWWTFWADDEATRRWASELAS